MLQRAIVADDDANLLEVVSEIIDHLGIVVVQASSGAELMTKLAHEGPFDVAVVDVAMPWMTGLHVMISARSAGMMCPVVVMTALRDARTTSQVIALGDHVHLLAKPFSMAQLEAAVLSSLEEII